MKSIVSLLIAALFFLPLPAWSTTSPTIEIQEIVDSVLQVLNNSNMDYATKRQTVSGVVQSHINILSISQRTLGVNWKNATPEQQQRFSKLFVQILEMTYLNRIESYSGGEVDYLKERIKGKKAIVDTHLITPKRKIPIQYKMVLENDEWQIYDVLIEKVSLVRNYRSTYGEIVSKEGFEGLFAKMDAKLAESPGSGGK